MSLQPVFSRVSQEQRAEFDRFFEYTSPENVQNYAQGWSLTNLVDLASKTISVIDRTNPIWDPNGEVRTDEPTAIQARQWQLDRISEVKERLAGAIPLKKSYYDNHWFGVITKYVLWCFGMWNNGTTSAIKAAEDFLLFYDTRTPLFYSDQRYHVRFFFPMVPCYWVRNNLDTSRFFNYNPERTIEIDTRNGFSVDRGVQLPANWVVV